MRSRIRTSRRSVFRHQPNFHPHAHLHHRHHLAADPHARSMAELELIAAHQQDAVPPDWFGDVRGVSSLRTIRAAREEPTGHCEMLPDLRW
jgi:hypothetical protein